MKSKQKFQLARAVIITTAISVTAIAIMWMIVNNNPSKVKATINFSYQIVEVDCEF